MIRIICVGIGGFCGAVSRFLITGWVHYFTGSAMPYGTLAVNVGGSFILAFLLQFFIAYPGISPHLKSAITIGFLGAFTTFSTFTVDTLHFIEQGNYGRALVNIVLNVVICLVAAAMGMALGKTWHQT